MPVIKPRIARCRSCPCSFGFRLSKSATPVAFGLPSESKPPAGYSAQWQPPVFVLKIPRDGAPQCRCEGLLWRPGKLAGKLVRINGEARIVPWSIGDELD